MAPSKVSTAAVINDSYVRECMFGGQWGAFDSTGGHFFKPSNSIYKSIAQIAAIRRNEPALRYGRQYFREISGNGIDFGYPSTANARLAYSRILDDSEIVIALNLDAAARADYITVDAISTRTAPSSKTTRSAAAVRGRSPRPAQRGESPACRARHGDSTANLTCGRRSWIIYPRQMNRSSIGSVVLSKPCSIW